MATLVDRLPADIVLFELVPQLDNRSVTLFLEAFPQYKRHAIVITDHPFPQRTFAVEGVERRVVSTRPAPHAPANAPAHRCYDRAVDSQQIKLFELCFANARLSPSFFDRTSFVAMVSSPECFGVLTLLHHDLLRHGRCSFQCSSAAHFAQTETLLDLLCLDGLVRIPTGLRSNPLLQTCNAVSASHLKTLRVEKIARFTCLDYPELTHLCVEFETNYKTRPLVSHIRLPKIQNLVIHYNDKTPVIYDVEAVTAREGMSFELGHLDSINSNRHHIHPLEDDTFMKAASSTELSFTSRFANVLLFGTPLAYVQKIGWSPGQKLRWHITQWFAKDIFTCLQVSSLSIVDITVSIPRVTLPNFIFKGPNEESQPRTVIFVNIMAPQIDISGLFERSSRHMINHLFISQDRSLFHSHPHQHLFQLKPFDWQVIRGKMCRGGSVQMAGFKMDDFLKLVQMHNDTSYPICILELAPVIIDSPHLEVNGLMISSSLGMDLRLNPIFLDKRGLKQARRKSRSLTLTNLHVACEMDRGAFGDSASFFKLAFPCSLTQCTINGRQMDLAQFHEKSKIGHMLEVQDIDNFHTRQWKYTPI